MPRIVISIAVLLLSACSSVHETVLPNGLKIIVKEDHRAPVVVSQLWYKVGSVDEPEGLTGISHVLEHMMFKGTKRLKPGEFSRIIAENGGRDNAFTGRDYTVYFQQLEKSRLPISFELEADRMQNLLLPEDEFKRELQVVMEERRLRTDDQPEGLVYEKFMHTAYQVHPYRNPIIGWMRDLERLTVKDLRTWYERYYAPNNATLVVVGDVDPKAVFALAERHFGPIPQQTVAHALPPPEPPPRETRTARVATPAEVPYLVLGFHTPRLTRDESPEPYALLVLAGVLDGGVGARFARNLIRGRQLAANVSADYEDIARYPGMFTVDGVPAQGRKVEELKDAILGEIERLKREPVTPQELERVKAQVVAQEVYTNDSVFAQAMRIGQLDNAGLDWRLIDRHVKRLHAVQAREVQEVAQKYLTLNNMTLVILDPLPMKQPRRPAPKDGAHVR